MMNDYSNIEQVYFMEMNTRFLLYILKSTALNIIKNYL